MNTKNQNLRQNYLNSLNQAECDTKFLANLLQEIQISYPTELDPYIADESCKINECESYWDEHYFSRQIVSANQNFALERLQHLLQVRERFRKQRRKGFAPLPQITKPLTPPDSTTIYTPSDLLRECVEEGKLISVRNALIMELNNKRLESNTLRSALAWALKNIPDLCEPYAEKAFSRGMNTNRDTWDRNYYMMQEVYLGTSFTKERYWHMIEVREHLRQLGVKGFAAVTSTKPAPSLQATEAPTPKDRTTSQGKNPPTPPHRTEMHPLLKTALLIGGAIAALAMLLLTLK